ncbi:MAG: glycosyltransferase family 2 protein [bacterium]|nr:glycosyltransferase family 2 protein [bacterium]
MKPFLSVIIPAYNEANRLPLTLVDVSKRLSSVDYDYEVIVVDDGSRDATVEVAKRFCHLMKNLRVIGNKENHGKGWVVRQGMLEARGQWRLFMDADNATSADQFSKMIPYLSDYQIIIGSRDIKGAKLVPPQPFYRRWLGNAGNLIIQLLLLPGIWDTQCGFKCFSEEATLKIFPLLKTNRWAFDIETLALGKELGYKIKEIPVVWVNDFRSKVKASAYLQVLWETQKIRWWLWLGKYNLRNKNL